MVDTIRLLTDLQTLLADNASGDISPQDLRDFLVTAVPSGRGATKVVASSDTPDPSLARSQADYVCDGTADQVEINAAIAAVTAMGVGGGEVILTGGSFTIAAAVTLASGVTLRGQGYATQLITTANISIISVTSVNNVVVRDLRLTGNSTGGTQNGIDLDTADNCRVEGLYVEDVGYDGIQALDELNRIVIINNWVDNCTDDGINVGGGWDAAVEDVVVSNNHVTGCGGSGIHISFMHRDVAVIGNTCVGNSYAGIDLALNAHSVSRTVISGNVVRDSDRYGIHVTGDYDPSDVIISNNIIENVDAAGGGTAGRAIYITRRSSRFIIANNIIRNAAVYGMVITSPDQGTVDRDITIMGNIISGEVTAVGIYIYNQSKVLVIGNTIHEITGSYAIQEASNCSGGLIANNKVEDTIEAGGSDTVVKDNIGAVASGEHFCAAGDLASGAANDFAFAWQNPHAKKVLIDYVIVEVTTAGGTATAVLDVDVVANATATGDDILDGIDLDATAVYDSRNDTDNGTNGEGRAIKCDENEGSNDYVTGKILVEAASSLVGKYYIYYTVV